MEFSKKVSALEQTPIRKFMPFADEARAEGKKVYTLNIGQPDIKTPDVFMEAIRNFDEKVLKYAPSYGIPELRNAVSEYYKRIGVEFTPEDILITMGGSEAINLVMTCILNPGDEVLMAEPFYTNYRAFTGQAEGKVTPIKTTASDGYHYADREKIENAITPRTKAIGVVNPGNPTGVVLTKEEMRLIADIAKEHDLFLVCDEVYREFVYDGLKMSSFAEFDDVRDRVVIIDSVSKRFSACGARCGSIATKNRELIEHLYKLLQTRLCAPTLEQIGSTALYGLEPNYFDEIKKEYEHRRNVSYEALQEIDGIICKKPQGAFYITCQLPVDNAEKFLVWLLKEFDLNGETAMFAPAAGFYATKGVGQSDIRLAYVLDAEEMRKGINIIKEGIIEYNKTQR